MSGLYVTVHTDPSTPSHGATFRVDERFDVVVEALLPDTDVPEPAWLDQARRNAELRTRFIETHGALTAEQVADLTESQATNRRQAAYRLAKDGKLFAIDWHGTLAYPAFQFDPETRHVRPQMAEVLTALAGELAGWELALWFDDAVYDPITRDYAVPLDVIDDAAHLVHLAEATVAQRRATGAA
jgi:hypothetical protein